MEIYFDTDYITVKYDAVHHIVISIAKVPSTSKEFRDGMMAILGAMQHFSAGRIVCDVVNLGAIQEDDQIWAAKEWRPMAVAAGHSRAAFVVPDDVFTNMSMEDMMEKADSGVSFAYFKRMEDALRWVTISQQKHVAQNKALGKTTDM